MNYPVLLLLFVSILAGHQSRAQHALEGHWWYCHEGEYYEVLIGDSLYQAMCSSSFPIYPMKFEEVSQNEIRVSDFFNVALMVPDKAVLSDSLQADTYPPSESLAEDSEDHTN